MKILMLIDALGLGGAEADFIRLAAFLDRRHAVSIALYEDVRTSSVMSLLPRRIPVHILPARGGRIARWRDRARGLRRLAQDHDVCLGFLPGPSALAALASGPTPTLISLRGSRAHDPVETPGQWVLARLVDPLAYRRASAIHSCSEGISWELRRLPASIRRRIVTIEGTIEAERLLAQAQEPVENFVPAGRPTVMVCGRLHPAKGIDRFIDIFARVHRSLPDAQLVVIGDGPDRALLLDRSDALGLPTAWDQAGDNTGAAVRFLGHRPAPHRFLAHAQVFAMPSRNEGLPNMLIEALATGVPILSADFPWGARQLLSGGAMASGFEQPVGVPLALEYGELLPPIDDESAHPLWADRVADHLRHPRPFLSRDLARRAIARFDLEQTGPRWEEVLGRLVRGAPPSQERDPA